MQRPGPAGLLDWAGRRAGIAVLVTGLAVFLLAQGYVTVYPSLVKDIPPEADDAFAYITKAVQMKECFFQDCPALKDLLTQEENSGPGTDPDTRFQMFSKTILIYHPLHSAAMAGLESLGFTWEGAYTAIWMAGFLLMTAGAAFLLTALFGPGGAGLALMILPFFRNDGLDFMIPTYMVTALALLLWTGILTRVRGLAWLMVLGALIMLPLHLIGIVQVLFALILYWLTAGRLFEKGRTIATLACLGLVALYLALPLIFSKPVFSVGPFADSWYGPLALFPANLKTVVTTLLRFVETHGGYLIFGLLLGLGAVFNTPVRKHRVILVFWLCLGLVAASFLPRAPHSPKRLSPHSDPCADPALRVPGPCRLGLAQGIGEMAGPDPDRTGNQAGRGREGGPVQLLETGGPVCGGSGPGPGLRVRGPGVPGLGRAGGGPHYQPQGLSF